MIRARLGFWYFSLPYIIGIFSALSSLLSSLRACTMHPFNANLDISGHCVALKTLPEYGAPQGHCPGGASSTCTLPAWAPAGSGRRLIGVRHFLPQSLHLYVGIRGLLSSPGTGRGMSQITVGKARRSRRRLLLEPGPARLMQGLGFSCNPASGSGMAQGMCSAGRALPVPTTSPPRTRQTAGVWGHSLSPGA